MIEPTEDEKLGTIGGGEQCQCEWRQWEDALRQFYRKKLKDDSFCLVISTHWVTSGYWVERNAEDDEHAKVYRTLREVKALEKRIRGRMEEIVDPVRGIKGKDLLNLGGIVY